MQTDNNSLIDALITIADNATLAARKFKELSESQLNFKINPEKWSVLECVEHLNRYGEFYLPEIEKALLSDKKAHHSGIYKSGLLGNWFANLMKVSNGKMTKMKTPGDKNPAGSKLTVLAIDRFLKQQEMLKSLLNQARQADLTNTKVPISLTRFVRLRLGDTLRFFVYHIERHIFQAEKVVSTRSRSTSSENSSDP